MNDVGRIEQTLVVSVQWVLGLSEFPSLSDLFILGGDMITIAVGVNSDCGFTIESHNRQPSIDPLQDTTLVVLDFDTVFGELFRVSAATRTDGAVRDHCSALILLAILFVLGLCDRTGDNRNVDFRVTANIDKDEVSLGCFHSGFDCLGFRLLLIVKHPAQVGRFDRSHFRAAAEESAELGLSELRLDRT